MEELKKQAEKLVQEELNRANEKFPLFHNSHEGYAVIKEELEESNEDMQYCFNTLKLLWKDIKDNQTMIAQLDDADYIKSYATLLICEAVQTAAMAEKFIQSFKEDKDGKVS